MAVKSKHSCKVNDYLKTQQIRGTSFDFPLPNPLSDLVSCFAQIYYKGFDFDSFIIYKYIFLSESIFSKETLKCVFWYLLPFPSPLPLTLDYALAYVRNQGLYMEYVLCNPLTLIYVDNGLAYVPI